MNKQNLYSENKKLSFSNKIFLDKDLSSYTWLKTGGKADIFIVGI